MQKRPLIAAALTVAVAAALMVAQPPEGRPGTGDQAGEAATGRPTATELTNRDRDAEGGGTMQPGSEATAGAGSGPGDAAAESAQRDLPAVAAAIALFAAQVGLKPDEVQLRRLEKVTWRDGALGCPQPGQFYAQMLVEGYRVELAGAGQEAEYHTDLRGRAVSCPGGGQAPLPAGQSDS